MLEHGARKWRRGLPEASGVATPKTPPARLSKVPGNSDAACQKQSTWQQQMQTYKNKKKEHGNKHWATTLNQSRQVVEAPTWMSTVPENGIAACPKHSACRHIRQGLKKKNEKANTFAICSRKRRLVKQATRVWWRR